MGFCRYLRCRLTACGLWKSQAFKLSFVVSRLLRFVALQDITSAMGPTWLCPRSHTAESHLAPWEAIAIARSGMLSMLHAVRSWVLGLYGALKVTFG